MNWLWQDNISLSFNTWQSMLFARASGAIILVGLVEYLLQRYPIILTLVFTSLRIENQAMTSFGVVLFNSDSQAFDKKVISSYMWTIRSAAMATFLIVWHSVVSKSDRFSINNVFSYNTVVTYCLNGWNCYIIKDPGTSAAGWWHDIVHNWFSWNMEPVCTKMVTAVGTEVFEDLSSRSAPGKTVPCFKLFRLDGLRMITGVTISLAFCAACFLLFDILVMILLRRTRRGFFGPNSAVMILTCISAAGAAARFIFDTARSVNPSGEETILLLCVTTILYQAQRAGRYLCKLKILDRTRQLKSLQNTELGELLGAVCTNETFEDGQPSPCDDEPSRVLAFLSHVKQLATRTP